MHRFELREALLIYRQGVRSFITCHDGLAQNRARPFGHFLPASVSSGRYS